MTEQRLNVKRETSIRTAVAFAPASVGNVAVGFDLLGHALEGIGDTVTATRIDEPVVRVTAIRGVVTDLPFDPENNTAARAVASLHAALGLDFGIELEIDKGIPLGSGLGGSAASATAALVAANALLAEPLTLALPAVLSAPALARSLRLAEAAQASLPFHLPHALQAP